MNTSREVINPYQLYLKDLTPLLIELAEETKKQASEKNDDWYSGRQSIFYEIFDLMKQQALGFEIKESDIGLDKVNPESFLK